MGEVPLEGLNNETLEVIYCRANGGSNRGLSDYYHRQMVVVIDPPRTLGIGLR